MKTRKPELLESHAKFKFEAITTYFCVISLFLLVVVFSSIAIFTTIWKTGDFLMLLGTTIFTIFLYFYSGIYLIATFHQNYMLKKCFDEIKDTDKSENIAILTKANTRTKRFFNYYKNTDTETGLVFITKKKPVQNKKYEIFEFELSNKKIYFAKEPFNNKQEYTENISNKITNQKLKY